MISKTGGRAFPCDQIVEMDDKGMRHGPEIASGGMTLRDYFAASCDVSAYSPIESLRHKLDRAPTVDEMADWIATVRFIEADAMIAARAT